MAGLTNVPSDPLNDAATCYSYVALCALSLHEAYPGQQNVPALRDFVHQLVEHLGLSENVKKIAIDPFFPAADPFDCCNPLYSADRTDHDPADGGRPALEGALRRPADGIALPGQLRLPPRIQIPRAGC